MVAAMQPGSVIVDLAAERGGNCELTRAGEDVDQRRRHDPRARPTWPAGMPHHASQLYSRNILALVKHLAAEDANSPSTSRTRSSPARC